MLRVSYSDTPDGERWCLYGRLAGPWVEELRRSWRQARKGTPLARAVIDLRDVVFIDEAGETLLGEMETSGAELIVSGVENKHLVESLKDRAGRPMRRAFEDLCGRCRDVRPPDGREK